MNTDFGKILQQIYDSSVAERWETMVVWQQFIILAAPTGVVDMTKESIARRTGIPLEMIETAIAELEAPDPKSRSKSEGGRRLLRLDPERDWGWSLVNYLSYRDNTQTDARKEYMKKYMAKYRKVNGEKESEKPVQTELIKSGAEAPKKSRITIEEARAYCIELELKASDGDAMIANWETNGWTVNGRPVRDCKAQIRKWKLFGYMPSQKKSAEQLIAERRRKGGNV